MTKSDFKTLFLRALKTAADSADETPMAPVPRSFLIELHAPGAPARLANVDEAIDHLYLGDTRFYKIIDVAIKELTVDGTVAFVRVSGHPPVDYRDTCDPSGLGPFKHMLAAHIRDRRVYNVDMSDPLRAIVGEKLSGVTFVLDYWQLQFDGPMITVLTRIEIQLNGSATHDGEDQFRNHLCAQIGKIVERTNVAKEAITIVFSDQSSINISLDERDYRGPEAALLHGHNRSVLWVV